MKLKKEINDHDHRNNPITTQEFNKLARLTQGILASKNHIADFVKKTDFGHKIKNLIQNVTSNKTRQKLKLN